MHSQDGVLLPVPSIHMAVCPVWQLIEQRASLFSLVPVQDSPAWLVESVANIKTNVVMNVRMAVVV